MPRLNAFALFAATVASFELAQAQPTSPHNIRAHISIALCITYGKPENKNKIYFLKLIV